MRLAADEESCLDVLKMEAERALGKTGVLLDSAGRMLKLGCC